MVTTTVHIECRLCQTNYDTGVSFGKYMQWAESRDLIQNVMPEVPAAIRELFITQTCDNCWKKLFPPEEKDVQP